MLQAEEDRNESIDDQSRDKAQIKVEEVEQRGRATGAAGCFGGSAHKKPNAIIAKLISHR